MLEAHLASKHPNFWEMNGNKSGLCFASNRLEWLSGMEALFS